jgi:hypothetical protein
LRIGESVAFKNLMQWAVGMGRAHNLRRPTVDARANNRIVIENLDARILFSADLNPFALLPRDLAGMTDPVAELISKISAN